ncbi:YlbE-like family protein [Alkalihalobacterium alkalinitrilicum]|uniref:YlbE-like family protein n=1 Tax=Alkalihalobacterium alkalinitrilicum TaxID=427920 RepID=UPI0009954436|nr:YlbE-like family protein [Alkalihalobacterium alkalinitrilicum]
MRNDINMLLRSQPELKQFIRQHPQWYRKLSRDPYQIKQLELEANQFYGKTFPQRMEKIQSNLQLAMMLVQMLQMNPFGGAPDQQPTNIDY